ncbi:hypothetical protein [Bacillus suaedae]|uniref:Uncharacterized protein n=1 Tax=Halalkalibacter suaedae TaxID=2822140 RepID=A0A941ARG4_9BACI|nr:hypothetical protein [Bacillus suaedae]MBP3952543.1 hypothetical protein [Bacillus suaedae]
MIEVITYADITFRVDSTSNYKTTVENLLLATQSDIKALEINNISPPKRNTDNGSHEVVVYGRLLINLPEVSKEKKVEQYIEDINPFLRRHLKQCNSVNNLKIIQMKRILENPDIEEHLTLYDN